MQKIHEIGRLKYNALLTYILETALYILIDPCIDLDVQMRATIQWKGIYGIVFEGFKIKTNTSDIKSATF